MVGRRGRKRRAEGAEALAAASAAAKADDAVLGGGSGVRCSPSCPPPRRRRGLSSLQRTRGGIIVGEGGDRDSTAYAVAESKGSWRDDGDRTQRWTMAVCLLDGMGRMTTMPSLLLHGIEDHDGGLSSL